MIRRRSGMSETGLGTATTEQKSNSSEASLIFAPQEFPIPLKHVMNSHAFSRAVRRSTLRQLTSSRIQSRTFSPLLTASRTAPIAAKKAIYLPLQHNRTLKTIDFAGQKETVYGGRGLGFFVYHTHTDPTLQSGMTGLERSSLYGS